MKKIFSILLLCCSAFAYADDEPVFEETDEKVTLKAFAPFAIEEPNFEEDGKDAYKTCEDCDDPNHQRGLLPRAFNSQQEKQRNQFSVSYTQWTRYKAKFGLEKLYVRFPHKPAVTQSNTLLTAYAYDNGNMYSINGYFPPIGNIVPKVWFDEILYSISHYPFTPISHVIYQSPNGFWVMDYKAHDYVKNLTLKSRAVVTPFNGYTLQCVKPHGARDSFDYFVDNFHILCE